MLETCFVCVCVSQVKSFIETQRALLAEIQNGCKRNFILAKEKEENEQKMRQSTSMAEIATEDGTGEDEEEERESASEESRDTEGETAGNAVQTGSESGACSDSNVPQTNLESDSDTEDEEESEVVTKSSPSSNSSTLSNQTAHQTHTGVAHSQLSASRTSSASSSGGSSVISVTVTESAAPPGTPPSPGRCISVSSPGRGHKIFMVTRVESPPEQQQQLQIISPAVPSLSREPSKTPVNTTQQTQSPGASRTPTQTQLTQEGVKENSPALLTDCKTTEQNPVALNTTQTHKLQSASTTEPTEDAAQPSLQSPLNSSSVQVTESANSPQPEPARVEGNKEEEERGPVGDDRQVMDRECRQSDALNPPQTSLPPQQELLTSALEQLQNDLVSASEETHSPHQTQDTLQDQEVAASLLENEKPSLAEAEQPNRGEPRPKQQTEAHGQETESFLSVHTDRQAPAVFEGGAQESNPQAGDATHSPNPAPSRPEAVAEINPPAEEEESADESSADEGESFAEALEGEVVGSSLPNGLKPEFSLHLLDTESPKPGSCVMEHGENA